VRLFRLGSTTNLLWIKNGYFETDCAVKQLFVQCLSGSLHITVSILFPFRCRVPFSVSCTFTYHTWQFIIFTIFTITTCIFSYSLSILFWTQDLALQQILSSLCLFLSYRTDSTDSRTSNDFTLLNGWICLHVFFVVAQLAK